jgi:hypothetical protein
VLIFQHVCLHYPWQANLFRASHRLVRLYNPHAQLMVIDSGSSIDPRTCLTGNWQICDLHHDDDVPIGPLGNWVFRFGDSIGHPYRGGPMAGARINGGGRGLMKGIDIAEANGVEYLGFVDYDVLCVRTLPAVEAFACLGPNRRIPLALQWDIFSINIGWAAKVDFVGRYDWAAYRNWKLHMDERHVAAIVGDDLRFLPFRGDRFEFDVSPAQLRALYPDGDCDWITHAEEPTLQEFLRMHGHVDVAAVFDPLNERAR